MIEMANVFIASLIYLFSYTICIKIISKENYKLSLKYFIKLLLFSVILSLLSVKGIVSINIISNLVLSIILNRNIFKIEKLKLVYYCICLLLIGLISDSFVAVILLNTELNNYIMFLKLYNIRCLLNILIIILNILFSKLLRVFIIKIYDKIICKVKNNYRYIFIFISFIYILLLFLLINAYSKINRQMHIIIVLLIFFFIILALGLLLMAYKLYVLRMTNEFAIKENDYIKKIAHQDKTFKHNILNNLLGIQSIADNNSKELINDLITKYKQEYKVIDNINQIPNGLNSIIYYKLLENNLSDLNITISNNLNNDLFKSLGPIRYNLFCESFGILIDNAIDAVKKEKEKILKIIFEEEKLFISVEIYNNFSGIIDFETIGKKEISNKTNGHGIGLMYILQKNNIQFHSSIVNNIFKTEIKIKKIK